MCSETRNQEDLGEDDTMPFRWPCRQPRYLTKLDRPEALRPRFTARLPGMIEPSLGVGSGDVGHTFRHCGGTQMPWRECHKMDKRLRGVARYSTGRRWSCCAGSSSAPARLSTRSSPPTGTERCRRPYRHARQLPFQIETFIGPETRSKRPRLVPQSCADHWNSAARAVQVLPGPDTVQVQFCVAVVE